MKDSDIQTISDCVNTANKIPFSEVEKWIQHLEENQNNDSHLDVKEEILEKLKSIIEVSKIQYTGGVGRKEVSKGLEPSWTDCCEGSCI